LQQGWSRFGAENATRWSSEALGRRGSSTSRCGRPSSRDTSTADAMRTVLASATSSRCPSVIGRANRAASGQGCVSSATSKAWRRMFRSYNIWDEYLTQVTRPDLLLPAPRHRRQRRQARRHPCAPRSPMSSAILFGDDRDLEAVFPRSSLGNLKALRHYYHPPAMGKCFPDYPQVEFMAGRGGR